MLYQLTFNGDVYIPADDVEEAIEYFRNKLKLLENHSFLDFNEVCIESVINNEG